MFSYELGAFESENISSCKYLFLFIQERPFDDIGSAYSGKLSERLKEDLLIGEVAIRGGPATKVLIHELFEFIIMTLGRENESQESGEVIDPDEPYVFIQY